MPNIPSAIIVESGRGSNAQVASGLLLLLMWHACRESKNSIQLPAEESTFKLVFYFNSKLVL